MPQGLCQKCFNPVAPNSVGLCPFHFDLANFGRAWADRDAEKTKPPKTLLLDHPCDTCAEHKQPGWIVTPEKKWIRCPKCNPA